MIDIEDIKLINLNPGDYLVVQCKGRISTENANTIRDTFNRRAPDIADRVIVVDDQISLAVLRHRN